MEGASSLRYGCMVHYYCLWCISIHRGFTSNLTEGKWFSQSCLHGGRVPMQANRLTQTIGKGIFHILFKTQKFFMLDKYSQSKNTSFEIIWISWHL